MSFVRTGLSGGAEPLNNPNPIVIDAGIPGFRATIPITTPERQQLAAYAVVGMGLMGFLVVAGALAYATRRK